MIHRVLLVLAVLVILLLMRNNYKEWSIFSTSNWWLIKNEVEREKLTQLLACNTVAWFIVLVMCIVKLVRG